MGAKILLKMKIALLPLFFLILVSYAFGENPVGFPNPGASKDLIEKFPYQKRTEQQNNNIASTSSSQGFSDLSIERIYLRGCSIHVNIVNKGSGGVSPKDYKGGKLLMTLQWQTPMAAGLSPYSFPLTQVDPNAVLSRPNTWIDFNTKVKPKHQDLIVRVWFENLKDDKGKGKKDVNIKLSIPVNCLENRETANSKDNVNMVGRVDLSHSTSSRINPDNVLSTSERDQNINRKFEI
ncbi:MAG: hypothetical protein ABIM76_07400 [candidate division WOR-3 bacterium]